MKHKFEEGSFESWVGKNESGLSGIYIAFPVPKGGLVVSSGTKFDRISMSFVNPEVMKRFIQKLHRFVIQPEIPGGFYKIQKLLKKNPCNLWLKKTSTPMSLRSSGIRDSNSRSSNCP